MPRPYELETKKYKGTGKPQEVIFGFQPRLLLISGDNGYFAMYGKVNGKYICHYANTKSTASILDPHPNGVKLTSGSAAKLLSMNEPGIDYWMTGFA